MIAGFAISNFLRSNNKLRVLNTRVIRCEKLKNYEILEYSNKLQ